MADGEYMRLCSVTECGGTHKAHGYCLRHYRQWQRGGIKTDATRCAHCGESFDPIHVGAMYCTKGCKRKAWRDANPGKVYTYRKQAKVCSVYAGYCETCGKAMVLRHKKRWCSVRCENKSRFVSIAPTHKNCSRCGVRFELGQFKTRPPDFCSAACKEEAHRATKRSCRRRRDAAERGVHAESVDPFVVFERDRWRCQLCGVKTPKAKRGTYEPNAPELDHIVPISKGGEHTYRNTQCACRRCNGDKGAKPMGQMLLIG